jgi:hypothetical protein
MRSDWPVWVVVGTLPWTPVVAGGPVTKQLESPPAGEVPPLAPYHP